MADFPRTSAVNPFEEVGRGGVVPVRDWHSQVNVSLGNLATGETLGTQFLPDTLEESVRAVYAMIDVPGLSHQPQQFQHTENVGYDLDLYFRIMYATDQQRLDDARKFLHAACYPREGADSVATGAPARILFVWPGLVSMTCTIHEVKIKYLQFSPQGLPTVFTARVTVQEVRDVRLFAEDVRLFGTQRGRREDYPEFLEGLDALPEEDVTVVEVDDEGVE